MALAEIDALSGYRFDAEQVHTLTSIEDLQRVEMEKDDTKMNVYFNPVTEHASRFLSNYFSSSVAVRYVSRYTLMSLIKLPIKNLPTSD